ncbi:hypothetical protein [Streptomyces blattellae]|uniref:hypothetical protein n=1 Tax=Streptomyces blattellae TaxID=2569855 RepID=UPI0012B991D9|nr:hypothetical protein [Streptomyces blattellae]
MVDVEEGDRQVGGLPSVPPRVPRVSPGMRNCLVWLSSPIHRVHGERAVDAQRHELIKTVDVAFPSRLVRGSVTGRRLSFELTRQNAVTHVAEDNSGACGPGRRRRAAVIISEVTSLGAGAARRLAETGLYEFEPGLSDAEFAGIEREYCFDFADDHRAFVLSATGSGTRSGVIHLAEVPVLVLPPDTASASPGMVSKNSPVALAPPHPGRESRQVLPEGRRCLRIPVFVDLASSA